MMRVNWESVIRDLRMKNDTVRKIGHTVGVSKTTVNRWQHEGWEPRHSTGERLIRHWMRKTGLDRSALPSLDL